MPACATARISSLSLTVSRVTLNAARGVCCAAPLPRQAVWPTWGPARASHAAPAREFLPLYNNSESPVESHYRASSVECVRERIKNGYNFFFVLLATVCQAQKGKFSSLAPRVSRENCDLQVD